MCGESTWQAPFPQRDTVIYLCLQDISSHHIVCVVYNMDIAPYMNQTYELLWRVKQYEHQYLTLKHREMHGCVVSTVATDALVLKHQAISIHNADLTFIILGQFHITILHL